MADQEGPGVEACVECGVLLLGDELPGLRGRRADRRLQIADAEGHCVAWQCPDCDHLWPRYTEGRRSDTARAMIAWTISKRTPL